MKASTLKGLLRSSSSSSSPGTAGSSSNDSPASKVEEDYVVLVGKKNMSSEATSYGTDAELELGLGLGLSIGGRTSAAGSDAGKPKVSTCGRILTAKDFPSVVGTKRAADSVSQEGGSSPPRVSQVVGWPPIRASRMYSLVNQAKTPRSEEEKVVTGDKEKSNDFALKNKTNNVSNRNVAKEQSNLGFVKVYFDGIAIGRKVDLSAHSCYETLAQTLEAMFFQPGMTLSLNGSSGEGEKASKPSKLLDGSSEFVLTYEDNDGDWMLVGEIPWGMFLSSVKRLRIMRNSEANGLAPRSQERNDRQRIKPI